MTQPLWYTKKDGKVLGPFPSPQIKEMLELGDLGPSDMISLDRQMWISVARSGHFQPPRAQSPDAPDHEDWNKEREKARERWLRGEAIETSDTRQIAEEDARRLAALASDHATTRQLIAARSRRRPPLILGAIALVVVTAIGVAVWQGQGDEKLRTSFEKVSNCAQPPAESVSWAGCVRAGEMLRGARLKNADLSGGNYDDANLSDSDLGYANLQQASLRRAVLRQVSAMGAELTGADLSEADLRGADLRYATLQGARLDGARLDGARLDKAIWPDGRACAENSVGQCR